ncbi:MAG: hypothetical protein RLZ99_818 [Actinomycetota bacterium]|jgi:hypothetical protein
MRKVVAVFLALPILLFPVAAFADESDSEDPSERESQEQVIGPQVHSPSGSAPKSEPIDVSKIVITDQTPADQFVMATTPLVLALGAGSIGLVIYTFVRGSKGEDKD